MNIINEIRAQFTYKNNIFFRVETEKTIVWYPHLSCILFLYNICDDSWYDIIDNNEEKRREIPPLIELEYQRVLRSMPVKDNKNYTHLLEGRELGLI
jgi:hypothetical protein